MKKNLLIIIISIVIVVCVVLGVVGLINNKNTKPNNDNNNNKTNVVENSIVGAYGRKEIYYTTNEDGSRGETVDEDDDGKPDYVTDSLYLREDGSFYLSYNNFNANEPSVGTYSIDKDTKIITLTETVRYGSDACFYTDGLKIYKAQIDGNKLSITINYETIILEKDLIPAEDKSTKAYYVTNPVDGQTAEGWSDAWMNCSLLEKK